MPEEIYSPVPSTQARFWREVVGSRVLVGYLLQTYWAATWTLGILLNDDDSGRMMCFLVLPRNWEGTKICKHWLDWILVKQVWDCLGNYVLLIGSAPTRGIFAQQLQWKIGLAPCNTNHPGPPITYHLSDLHHKRYLLDLFGTCLNLGGQHILNVSYILEGEVPPPPIPPGGWYRRLRSKVGMSPLGPLGRYTSTGTVGQCHQQLIEARAWYVGERFEAIWIIYFPTNWGAI